jgi:hypothetical protein
MRRDLQAKRSGSAGREFVAKGRPPAPQLEVVSAASLPASGI